MNMTPTWTVMYLIRHIRCYHFGKGFDFIILYGSSQSLSMVEYLFVMEPRNDLRISYSAYVFAV